jgi:hypothetical protein
MAYCKKIPNHLTTKQQVVRNNQRRVLRNKVPSSCKLELLATSITPNKVELGGNTLGPSNDPNAS